MAFLMVCWSLGLGLIYTAVIKGNALDFLGFAALALAVQLPLGLAFRQVRRHERVSLTAIVASSVIAGVMAIELFGQSYLRGSAVSVIVFVVVILVIWFIRRNSDDASSTQQTTRHVDDDPTPQEPIV